MTNPDYSKYTLKELYDALNHIDREKYPERLKKIKIEIKKRKKIFSLQDEKVKVDTDINQDDNDKLEDFKEIKKYMKILVPSLVIIIIVLIVELQPKSNPTDNMWNKLYYVSFHSTVDSVYLGYRIHKILVNDIWYELPCTYYTSFIEYVNKGDSLLKKSNDWSITVKRKKGDRWVIEYFKGAKGEWD